jgi:DNA primase
MVQNSKIEILSNMFRKPKPFIEFVLDEILLSYDLKNPKAKERCMQEGIAYLKTLSVILQEEYRVYFASRLGISPSFLRLNTGGNFEQRMPMQQSSHKDMWELSIIKTILEHPEFIEHILDIIDPKMFQFHSREFMLALEQKNDTMELMAILIDESIKGLKNLEALNSELITFLSKYYDKELKKLSYASNISFEEKAFLIRKFRDKIARLKKGELVSVRPQ